MIPGQLEAGVQDTVNTLAANLETLAAELRQILEAADGFRMPDIAVQMLAEGEGKVACGVRLLARSAGLVVK